MIFSLFQVVSSLCESSLGHRAVDDLLTRRLLRTLGDLVPMDVARRRELVEGARSLEKSTLSLVGEGTRSIEEEEAIEDLIEGASKRHHVRFKDVCLKKGVERISGQRLRVKASSANEERKLPLSKLYSLCVEKEQAASSSEADSDCYWKGVLDPDRESLLVALMPFNRELSWQETEVVSALKLFSAPPNRRIVDAKVVMNAITNFLSSGNYRVSQEGARECEDFLLRQLHRLHEGDLGEESTTLAEVALRLYASISKAPHSPSVPCATVLSICKLFRRDVDRSFSACATVKSHAELCQVLEEMRIVGKGKLDGAFEVAFGGATWSKHVLAPEVLEAGIPTLMRCLREDLKQPLPREDQSFMRDFSRETREIFVFYRNVAADMAMTSPSSFTSCELYLLS